jgi:HEAT repeat protein
MMQIEEIETFLKSTDSQDRLNAIAALKDYEVEVAVPLLLSHLRDREFLVRSFVAMGLGKKRTAESFAALLELIKFDRDPNVRAEASNSLSLFGQVSISHLVQAFFQDEHWLVRRSILAAAVELNCPAELLEICVCGLEGEDPTVRETSIEALALFADSPYQERALQHILPLARADEWRTRVSVAKALKKFNKPEAREILAQLRQDEDHRVVAAVLETFV